MTTSPISLEAARLLRGGDMPHVPPPASPTQSSVRLLLQAAPDARPEALFTDPRREHGWRVALSWDAGAGVWYADIMLPQEPTVLSYHFVLRNGATVRERRQLEGHVEPLFDVWEEKEFTLAVYDPHDTPPGWLPGSVFYQIFPDRFCIGDPENVKKGGKVYGQEPLYLNWDDVPEHPPKGRDFFGGDLKGVTSKLDYLRDLGITCIYFTPIFASPTNHRYDALDYTLLDPRLGTEADLRDLIAEGKKRGISILLDGVFNHCSSDSIYFKGAQAGKESPYYRWFDFVTWPHRWVGWLGGRGRLTTLGVRNMPELVECPEVEDFFFGENGIALRWMRLGTAGWRTDVTPWMTDEFWRRFRRSVRRANPDAYIVAEDWTNATHRLVGDTFDATMNYRFGYSVLSFVRGNISASELDDRLETLRRDTPLPSFHAQMNLIDSHDTARLLTRVEGSKERVKLAAALQLSYPGAPTIYSGTEAGVEGKDAEDGRRPFPWGKEDPELLAFYRTAVNARRNSPALSKGDVTTVWIDDRGGYGFLRSYEGERVIALFNNADTPLEARIVLPDIPNSEWQDLLGKQLAATVQGGILRATISPASAGWFQQA
ncbi:MAG: glycoside hydrolase family 13 protein [Chloroflexia bacterium]